MKLIASNRSGLMVYGLTLAVLVLFAVMIKIIDVESYGQQAGLLNFSAAFLLLAAYLSARVLKSLNLPMISGYIVAGIIAGPHITAFLTGEMVSSLQLFDDLALAFIALSAGGELHFEFLKDRIRQILIIIFLQCLLVFAFVILFVLLLGDWFSFIGNLAPSRKLSLAILLGIAAIARSPSSAIAIISECRAKGVFTDTVLGVTVVKDVLVIVLFTASLAAVEFILGGRGTIDPSVIYYLFAEILLSMIFGVILGQGIALYIRLAGHDLRLFLLFTALCVAKSAAWINQNLASVFHIHMTLEPLLICISAGFTVRNLSTVGDEFVHALDDMALPVFVIFFSVAGAALDLQALAECWPVALGICLVRAAGIFMGTWTAGIINGDPPVHNRVGWMAYLTQAGVAIGLAQIASEKFPEMGVYLTTIVLAVITINQVAGPITFKIALSKAGETEEKRLQKRAENQPAEEDAEGPLGGLSEGQSFKKFDE